MLLLLCEGSSEETDLDEKKVEDGQIGSLKKNTKTANIRKPVTTRILQKFVTRKSAEEKIPSFSFRVLLGFVVDIF